MKTRVCKHKRPPTRRQYTHTAFYACTGAGTLSRARAGFFFVDFETTETRAQSRDVVCGK